MTPLHFVVEGEQDRFVVGRALSMIELFVKQDNCGVRPNLAFYVKSRCLMF